MAFTESIHAVPSASADDDFLPYGRHAVDADDIQAVVDVLRSNWLTTGPAVAAFEAAFCAAVNANEAVAVSSGTAALHTALYALGIGPGDEVVVPAMTFAATANAVVFQGATPVFADVDADTLLLNPDAAADRITPRTRAVIAVDYAGQPCDYDALRDLCNAHDLFLVADACHSLGAAYKKRSVGSLADISVFSFHPVKHITTGEGGMAATDRPDLARKMRRFRNHGIDADLHRRAAQNTWHYAMTDLGYNYRLSDLQSALGLSQLNRLETWIARRRALAGRYDAAFEGHSLIRPLSIRADVNHAFHLYVVRLVNADRGRVFSAMRRRGIGVNVHYIPVHLHPFYQQRFGWSQGMLPQTEAAYEAILSLPLYPTLSSSDLQRVIDTLIQVVQDNAA